MPRNMKKLDFLDIDVAEFAWQLTIIKSQLYGKTKLTRCLNKMWQRKLARASQILRPTLTALTLGLTATMSISATSILLITLSNNALALLIINSYATERGTNRWVN